MENSKESLKGTYDAIVENGTPTRPSGLMYLSEGLYLTQEGDIIEI
jgi:hypothetical protein